MRVRVLVVILGLMGLKVRLTLLEGLAHGLAGDEGSSGV